MANIISPSTIRSLLSIATSLNESLERIEFRPENVTLDGLDRIRKTTNTLLQSQRDSLSPKIAALLSKPEQGVSVAQLKLNLKSVVALLRSQALSWEQQIFSPYVDLSLSQSSSPGEEEKSPKNPNEPPLLPPSPLHSSGQRKVPGNVSSKGFTRI